MGRINYEGVFSGDAAAVHALLTDETFLADCARNAGALGQDVSVSRSGGNTVVRVLATMPTAAVPAVAQRFLGPTADSEHTISWRRLGPDAWSATVEVQLSGPRKARLTGTAWLQSHPYGSVLRVQGDVTVDVPLAGKQLAAMASVAIRDALDTQTAEVNARLRHISGAGPVAGSATRPAARFPSQSRHRPLSA